MKSIFKSFSCPTVRQGIRYKKNKASLLYLVRASLHNICHPINASVGICKTFRPLGGKCSHKSWPVCVISVNIDCIAQALKSDLSVAGECPFFTKLTVQICGDFPLVVEACIEPFDGDDIKPESDLTILLWQSFKSFTDNVLLLCHRPHTAARH